MSQRFLLQHFEQWCQNDEPLALVTVIATAGSTYSKAGRHLLIRMNGEHAGLVSGGCLEGDLADHARDVIQSGTSRRLSYDMRDEADELWGMGVGCNGMIEVLVQKLARENDWYPFRHLANAISACEARNVSLATQETATGIAAGDICVRDLAGNFIEGNASLVAHVSRLADSANSIDGIIHWQTLPWPRLLVLGAGPDAEPLCQMALNLGWEVCVVDHRPALVGSAAFAAADQCRVVEAARLSEEIDLTHYSACVVMSHHLETDRRYIEQLAEHLPNREDGYVGVLGPAARRARILSDIGTIPAEFAGRLRGPVGLDIGADSPESIALAVLSEIQAAHAKRSGRPLHQDDD